MARKLQDRTRAVVDEAQRVSLEKRGTRGIGGGA